MTFDELFAIGDTLFDFLLPRGLDKEHRASRTTGWRFALGSKRRKAFQPGLARCVGDEGL
jgi:hypothetical protein